MQQHPAQSWIPASMMHSKWQWRFQCRQATPHSPANIPPTPAGSCVAARLPTPDTEPATVSGVANAAFATCCDSFRGSALDGCGLRRRALCREYPAPSRVLTYNLLSRRDSVNFDGKGHGVDTGLSRRDFAVYGIAAAQRTVCQHATRSWILLMNYTCATGHVCVAAPFILDRRGLRSLCGQTPDIRALYFLLYGIIILFWTVSSSCDVA